MRRRTKIPIALALASLALTGCTQAVARHSVRMFCEAPAGSVESAVLLMAQAVPSAQVVPCVNAYPAGWSIHSFEARSGRVTITFDSDRAGTGALEVMFEASCTPRGLALQSDEAGAPSLREQTFVSSSKYRAIRYYTFEGGCMLYTLSFPYGTGSLFTAEAVLMVHLIERKTLRTQLAKFGFGL